MNNQASPIVTPSPGLDARPQISVPKQRRIIIAFEHRPTEMICAVVLIGAGVVVGVAGTGAGWSLFGAALSALGGILFSWSMASVDSIEQAAELLRPQLETTSRHLGTVSGQMAQVIQAVNSGRLTQETGFALILQANGTLYNLVSDLQRLTGTAFDSQGLIETVERLDDLATKISKFPGATSDIEETAQAEQFREEIDSLKQQLRTQLTQLGRPTREFEKVRVRCPHCETPQGVFLGNMPGDSATPICASCGTRFHANRRGDGTVVTRAHGASFNPQEFEPLNEYELIVRHQGVKLPPATVREALLPVLADALKAMPGERADSWDALEDAIAKLAHEGNHDVTPEYIRQVRQLVYRARIFHLSPETGIGLRYGITRENILNAVNANLASRVYQTVEDEVDCSKLSRLLYGTESKAEEARLVLDDMVTVKDPPPSSAPAMQGPNVATP